MKAKRTRKDMYYLNIAEAVATKSTCLRRCYGAVIVKDDEIISTGYNGAPRGCPNCDECGCFRELIGVMKGDAYNLCMSVHAEQNAIISARRRDMIGATLYIVGINSPHIEAECGMHYADPSPCLLCHRMIINAGIARVVGLIESGPHSEAVITELDVTTESFVRKVQNEYRKTVDALEKDAHTPEEASVIAKARILIEQRELLVEGEKSACNDQSISN